MEMFYLIIVICLFLLAIFDLVVGVSNDAVNFLNSAIGSKVARFKTIMIVASIGIIIGAFTSAGMMEVARKGIFNPQYFYFNEIMVIFIAVMLTDILLLDMFNTYGLPTSTTVSIVFELLGAAVFVSIFKITQNQESMALLGEYINTKKAIQIILGIFSSIVIAFTVGAIIQYVSRLLFSFQYKRRLKYFGAIYGGLAFTALSYFLLIKGLKGSFLKDDIAFMTEHPMATLGVMFVGFTAVMFILNNVLKLPILKFIVLFGTLSLAAAFAGNDLVNFIGVPIAGFQSYLAWVDSGVAANAFSMEVMAQKVPTPVYLLFAAGIIMTLTLWFNKKARTVTETEVNLGRQTEGLERFQPNFVARTIVKMMRAVNNVYKTIMPNSLQAKLGENFIDVDDMESQGRAFDTIRASVNLVVASILITIATNMKLPLSTTYVSFMVAMGTSLSDKAWGRESAAYRVAGVLHVIAGWFLTAAIAFTVAGLFALLLMWHPQIALACLLLLVVLALTRNHFAHKKMAEKKSKSEKYAVLENYEMPEAVYKFNEQVAGIYEQVKQSYDDALDSLFTENPKKVRKAIAAVGNLKDEYTGLQEQLFKIIKKNKHQSNDIGEFYVYNADHLQELVESAENLVKTIETHIENSHKPLKKEQVGMLNHLRNKSNIYFDAIIQKLRSENNSDFTDLMERKNDALKSTEQIISTQVQGVVDKKYGFKNTNTVMSLVLENKDIISISSRFLDETAKVIKKIT